MSKAKRNVLAIIGLAGSLPEIIETKYGDNPPKIVKALSARIQATFIEAERVWPLDKKDLGGIAKKLKMFEEKYLMTDAYDIDLVVYMSMILGLLEDIVALLNDKKRIGVLKKLSRSVNGLFRYYDRNLDKYPIYDRANDMIRSWQMMEA